MGKSDSLFLLTFRKGLLTTSSPPPTRSHFWVHPTPVLPVLAGTRNLWVTWYTLCLPWGPGTRGSGAASTPTPSYSREPPQLKSPRSLPVGFREKKLCCMLKVLRVLSERGYFPILIWSVDKCIYFKRRMEFTEFRWNVNVCEHPDLP